jgi:hypothetical protein
LDNDINYPLHEVQRGTTYLVQLTFMLTELCLEAVSRVRQKMVRESLQSAAKKRSFLGKFPKCGEKWVAALCKVRQ